MTLRILCHARACMSVGLLVALTACATGGQVSTPAPDHAATTTTDAVVVAAHPLAVDAGTAVPRRGGQIGTASVRERVWRDAVVLAGAACCKKKKQHQTQYQK